MSTTRPGDPGADGQTGPRPVGRLGPWFASIWLFFLLDPLLAGWDDRNRVEGVAGIVATVAFGTLYMLLWIQSRRERAQYVDRPPLGAAAAWLAGLALLGVAMVALLGEPGIACSVYLAVAGVLVLPFRLAAALAVSVVVVVLALGSLESWGSQVGTAFGVMAASVAIFGLRTILSRNLALIQAQQENASLAVENERTRFARDLHDILGHSLTVITVKAELAQRVFDLDPARARAELADLERLSRDALADVRRAVEGYRELTLPGELTRARIALGAAEIRAELPNATDEVPSDLRELFAWTVREGVTNVIRHSGAQACEIRLTPTSAEVRDDGHGCPEAPAGSGLVGLRERAAAVGATVVTRDLSPGYSLQVIRG